MTTRAERRAQRHRPTPQERRAAARDFNAQLDAIRALERTPAPPRRRRSVLMNVLLAVAAVADNEPHLLPIPARSRGSS